MHNDDVINDTINNVINDVINDIMLHDLVQHDFDWNIIMFQVSHGINIAVGIALKGSWIPRFSSTTGQGKKGYTQAETSFEYFFTFQQILHGFNFIPQK